MTTGPVVIVGGGLAGLAAAVMLGDAGVAVTLLESRPRWGGRASSFVDSATGETIDNCQHVSMGCCTNFSHFCRLVGIDKFFQREETLWFFGPDGSRSTLSNAPLPAPLHLFPAFAQLRFLSWHDKWHLAWGLRALARTDPQSVENKPFADWLVQYKQTPAAIERFWHVVLVSALSESLERINVGAARKVFVDGFLANRHGWEVLLPTVSLDELYGERLVGWFAQHKVDARLQCGVKQVLIDGDVACGVQLRNGERIDAAQVIVAVPHNLVLSLLPDEWRHHPQFVATEQMETAPISSVHLWFDRAITELPHATFVGRTSQWLFNREKIQQTKKDGHYYQVVISASRDVVERSQDETIQQVVAELAEIWPVVRDARLLHARLVTEHRAVVSMRPGVERLRPPQQSPIANLQLAGDWTRTGWPCTMEGAVRGGFLAAENVLRNLGQPRTLVQPDLPVALLSRVLLGL